MSPESGTTRRNYATVGFGRYQGLARRIQEIPRIRPYESLSLGHGKGIRQVVGASRLLVDKDEYMTPFRESQRLLFGIETIEWLSLCNLDSATASTVGKTMRDDIWMEGKAPYTVLVQV